MRPNMRQKTEAQRNPANVETRSDCFKRPKQEGAEKERAGWGTLRRGWRQPGSPADRALPKDKRTPHLLPFILQEKKKKRSQVSQADKPNTFI